ncbi:serine/threonine protein kinase [Labilithrix luteola]|uniref:Serine/threonine protein kinase n=1 Tax=Labilithrix luteola TaxID=1391654 RepID=A0A0K1QA08_9BACT|nr:serine/threonine-protein kinase [Labilithrix luteola]AKV02579.1 serine/threonine protein kinase [Labilithrix luteola]
MKLRQSFPAGQSSASKIKAMLLCLDAKKGTKAADAWLAKLRLARADLEDETRLLPLGALRSAIAAFLSELPDSLDAMAPYLIAQDNLGCWARILRGTRAPEEAFARMDASDSEHGRTTLWDTIDAGPGHWHGRVRIAHDPTLEKDGVLARARAVELSVVPMLFGYARGVVTMRSSEDVTQEFDVRWALPNTGRGVAIGAAAGVVLGGGALAAAPSSFGLFAALGAPLIFGGAGLVWSRDRERRIADAAQAVRVSALERSLALRETEDRAPAGDLDGLVVAGQYRIGARMGSGASGVIYEATRITDGLPVAIKLLRAATAHDAVASDRLRREAEALGLAWHPNVVEVIDHGHLPDGTAYLVMELLRGEVLANRLKYRGRLSSDEVYPIALQLAEAFVAVHAAGVVHRDLKPANVYLTRDPETGGERLKVLDFGIARVEWEEMRITNIGAPLGTPGYMSPEQESGADVDARSDIFAIGALLYECLVGEPPPPSTEDMWKAGSRPRSSLGLRVHEDVGFMSDRIDLTYRLDSGVQPASRKLPSAAPVALAEPLDVPPAWRAIVERALAKRPEERFQDTRSFQQAIRALSGSIIPPASEASST